MGHTAVSATQAFSVTLLDLATWSQKENYCNFASFNILVNAKTSMSPNRTKYIKCWLENES